MPDSVKNKTPKEIADLVRQYENALTQVATTYQQPQRQQPVQPNGYGYQQAAQPQAGGYPTADPGLEPDLFRQQLDAYVRTTASQVIEDRAGPVLQGTTSNARWASSTDPAWNTVYQKYGGEIDALMASVPPQYKTMKETWDNAARIVRGNHVDEIAQSRAEQLIANGSFPTVRGGNAPQPGAPTGYGDEIDQFFADGNQPYVQWARDNNVTAGMMREYARKAGRTPAEQVRMMQQSQTIRASVRPSEKGQAH